MGWIITALIQLVLWTNVLLAVGWCCIRYAAVLSINAVKEIYDDYFRHRSDAVVNSSAVEVVLSSGPGMSTKWRDLAVGDVVRVRGNTEFPAVGLYNFTHSFLEASGLNPRSFNVNFWFLWSSKRCFHVQLVPLHHGPHHDPIQRPPGPVLRGDSEPGRRDEP
jgi:hypothetical protein